MVVAGALTPPLKVVRSSTRRRSSLDCAKGINFLLTIGGSMRDLGIREGARGDAADDRVPTTAGLGARRKVILDLRRRDSREDGLRDPAPRSAPVILDPVLTISQPRKVTPPPLRSRRARRLDFRDDEAQRPLGDFLARRWRLLVGNYERVLAMPEDIEARGAMQLGAYFAGTAIENSMLGAAHACANPLTASYGIEHGAALATLLPSVVRWNKKTVGARYDELMNSNSKRHVNDDGESLARRLGQMVEPDH